MSQRVLAAVAATWVDLSTLRGWFSRLPPGSEVLYHARAEAGVDVLQELIVEAGLVPRPREDEAAELARAERLDAVLVFASRPLLDELNVLVAAWRRSVRATLIPPAPERRGAEERA